MARYAISDIHGCAATFKALLDQLHFSKEDELYLLGDYIDRGPDSKGVIDHIWYLQNTGHFVQCIKGNHEAMMVSSLKDHDYERHWLPHGGKNTLKSFGVDAVSDVPARYMYWIQDLPHVLEVAGYILVHAGLPFNRENYMGDLEEMLWIRNWYHRIDSKWLDGRIIVHGHTPKEESEIKLGLNNLLLVQALDIDNGCVFNSDGLGQLCAFNLDERKLTFLPCLDN